MFGLGPVSSLYDFLTFGLMLWVFHAGEELFRTGWFVESLATQTFVIFIIRPAGNPFCSRPSRALTLSVVGSVAAGIAIAVRPIGALVGFTPLPPAFFAALAVLAGSYLALVELVKRRVYRASGWTAE
ncbi:MAG TPA: cation transporting ATPase C-terminal domain-containing protein [Chloroflexota bacterium]|jgi:Mg2+-importing ATPase